MTRNNKPSRLSSRLLISVGNRIAPQGIGEGRLCILNYHRILASPDPLLSEDPDVKTFRSQMKLLAECFNVLPLKDAVSALTNQRMPPRAVCITFDDGYRSIHDLAAPILKEFNLPATVFVTSGYIGASNMWNDRIVEAVRRIPVGPLDLRDIGMGIKPLNLTKDRKNTLQEITKAAKYLPTKTRLELISKLEILAGGASTGALMLTAEMIKSLVRQGIDIGAHTITHPILSTLDDNSAYHEINGSKHQLESITGRPVTLFAYPNGKTGIDFDDRHARMAKEAGFTAAFTVATGAATKQHDRYQIPRSLPWDTSSLMFGVRMLHWLRGKNT